MNFSGSLFSISHSHCHHFCCLQVFLPRSLPWSYPWRLLVESSFIFSTITIAADPLSDAVDALDDSSGGGGATEGGCEPVPVPAPVVLLAVAAVEPAPAATPVVVDCCSRNCRRRFFIHSSWQSWFRGRSGGGILDVRDATLKLLGLTISNKYTVWSLVSRDIL